MSAPLELHIDRKNFTGANGGEVEAVRGLHLTMPTGSLTALIGPSGCGKTTSLHILAGLDTAFTGRIVMPVETRIGFVFQEPRLLPWRTVEDNIRLVLDKPDALDLTPLLTELGIEDKRHRFPTELSLGLARRVAIARALAIQPDLLLLDEPFTSLDETTAQRLRLLVLDVFARRRPTTVIVTHNIREAILLADRILLLSHRPSHVVTELTFDRPQQDRDEAYIEARRNALIAEWPGLIA